MSGNTSIKIDRDVRQGIVVGGNFNGSIEVNFQAPDAVTDMYIIKWLLEGLHLLSADRSRAHAILAGKPETYINILKAPENSGRWLLGHPLFIAWRDGTLQTRQLWCIGMPGLGKSTLTSLIIKNLHSINQPGAHPSACIYLYFEREHRGQRQPNPDSSQLHVSLVNNLLAQLVSHTKPVSQLIREKYEKSLAGQGLTIQDSLDLLDKEASSFGVVYVVVDALDKCDSGNGQATDENPRYAFLRRILDLGPKFRHLVVSTYQRDIAILLSEGEKVVISKEDITTDLKIFVRSRLQEELQSRDDDTAGESFLDTCCDEIIQRSEGQYLRAKLLINQLFFRKRTAQDLRIKLGDLPSAQDKIYRDSVHDIIHRDNNHRTQLTHILQWLTFAMRPLTLDELSCAISVPQITPLLETDTNVLTADELYRLCGDFVVYDGETVSIAHSTAADFLERTYFPETIKNPETLIAEKCILYLSNPSLKNTLSQSSQQPLALRLEHHPLFTYAAMNWREHFVIATAEGSDLTAQVTDMLSDDNIVTSIYNTMVTPNKENGVTGLHLAALFNLGDIVDSLVNISKARGGSSGDPKQHKSWLDKKTESGETALHYAIRESHGDDNQEVVKKLLCHGINPNIKNKDGQTALHQAIILKKAEAALVLASSDKDNELPHPLLVDMPDEHGYTPLMSAAEHGMVEVVRALTNAGANVDARTEDGRSVLEIAANNNHRELVEVILSRKAKTRLEGFSILHWAAEHGYEEIIRELRMREEDMNLVTSKGSPMICAVRHGHGMPAWLLLNWGAKLDVSDYDGNTALHAAVEKSAESIIWLLLESGANPNIYNNKYETPLHRAVLNGDVSAVWLLLHKGSKPELRNKDGDMPLHIAAREGAISTARLLIEAGADVNAESSDGCGQTPLHIAAKQGKNAAEFIQFLIATCTGRLELDLNSKDACGRTPLHTAVNSDDEPAARALLAGGADPNPTNKGGLTPLHEAAAKERVPVVKALLEYVDIEEPDEQGQTVVENVILYMHTGKEYEKAKLATLLYAGVDVTRRSKHDGATPLHVAAFLGSTEAIKMMYSIADPPPDLTIEDDDGRTAVQVGIEEGHEIDWKWGN